MVFERPETSGDQFGREIVRQAEPAPGQEPEVEQPVTYERGEGQDTVPGVFAPEPQPDLPNPLDPDVLPPGQRG